MILVVSHPADPHAAGVLNLLQRRRHPVVMVDTSEFPKRSRLVERFGAEGARFEMTVAGRRVNLGLCRSGWWRRPLQYTLHDGIAEDAAAFTYAECNEAVVGMWAALDITWVNPPALDEQAHHKPYQLAVAGEVGLRVPETLITNDRDAAREFVGHHGMGGTIYKTFIADEDNWRETRLFGEKEMGMIDQVELAPLIFQEYVEAVEDLRITVVGDEIFCAAITPAPGGYQIDYRMDLEGAGYRPTEVPAEVEKGLRALMERLGLVYGAIDMRRNAQGEHVFLEVNPAGEWLFVEEKTDQPITEAMTNLLIGLDQR